MLKMKRTSNSCSLPADLSIDDPHNWDFDAVSKKEEQVACCWWEYARESKYIRNLISVLHRETLQSLSERPPRWVDNERELCEHLSLRSAARRHLRSCGKFAYIVAGAIEYNPEYQRFPQPWQSLENSPEYKKIKRGEKPKRVPVEDGQWSDMRLVVQQATEHLNKSQVSPEDFHGQGNSVIPTILDDVENVEIAVLKIHWDQYDDPTIKRAFNRWVDKNRPPIFRKPKGRPRGTFDPTSALRCLAIMRALRDHTAAEVSRMFPKLYDSCSGKHFRDRERALKLFHQLFPTPLPCPDVDRDNSGFKVFHRRFPKPMGELPLSWGKLEK